jgi:hypothetical protein
MPKTEFGQSYCKDLLKRITKKFSLYFFKFYSIFYGFLNLKQISRKNEKV